MKYKIIIFLMLFCITHSLKSQTYFYDNNYYETPLIFEAGISVGPMNSLTDLGGRVGNGKRGVKDLNIKNTTLYGSIYVGANYKNFLGVRLEGTIGKVKSYDSLLAGVKTTAWGRYNRNLSFRSPIKEILLTLELHPLDFIRTLDPPTFSPYIIAGIGYFHFNPQARLGSEWIDLKPLHTEGQGFAEYPKSKEYKLNQINIPLGVGIKYELSGKFNLRLEYIIRKLQTDYLDDVRDKYIDPAVFSKYLSGPQLTQALILNNRKRSDAVPTQTTARPFGKRGDPRQGNHRGIGIPGSELVRRSALHHSCPIRQGAGCHAASRTPARDGCR
ncbi:MAG: DUF6089 family protein [Ginsengibacter sp.]